MNLKAVITWCGQRLGEITTAQGLAALLGTLSAVLLGQMTWQHAVPLLVGAVIGILWPENGSRNPLHSGAAARVSSTI